MLEGVRRHVLRYTHRKYLKRLGDQITDVEEHCDRLYDLRELFGGASFKEAVFEVREKASVWETQFRITAHHIVALDPVLYRRGWRVLRRIEELERLGGSHA